MGASPPVSAPLKVLDGLTFAIGTLPASVAIEVECIVARAIGESLFRLVAATDAPEAEQAMAAGQAIAALSQRLNAKELKELFSLVFSAVTVGDGIAPAVAINFDAVFTGKPKLPWLLLTEALKVNFADFFPASLSTSLAASIQKLQKSS